MAMPAKSGQPLSLAALQVVKASLGENTALATLAGLAESDPGFAVRVLALVNSAALGLGREKADQVVKEVPAIAAAAARGLDVETIDERAIGTTLVDVNRSLAALNQSYEVMV